MPNRHIQEIIDNQTKYLQTAQQQCVSKYGLNYLSKKNDSYFNETSKEHMCPPYWDEILCWPYTAAGQMAVLPCPSYITGFKTDQFALRNCTNDGTWYANKSTNALWADYTACMDGRIITIFTQNQKTDNISQTFEVLISTTKIISQVGYAVSLLSLVIAFIIMLLIRRLHCARNILHMNLFASFIFRGFFYIMKDILFVGGTGFSEDFMQKDGELFFKTDLETNNFGCKLLTTLVQYFTTANYSWIFMEGIYLNNLVFRSPFADSSRHLMYFIGFGWGLPILVIVPWVIARIYIDDTFCWTTNDNLYAFLILVIPTIISVLVAFIAGIYQTCKLNFILFITISIVLYTKLSSPIICERKRRYRKWAKSTLVLVPLFGAHYAILLLFYFVGQTEIWIVCDTLFGSFQGFFVAVLYCFLNGEVKTELKPYVQNLLSYIAQHRILRICFPCRDRFLRSAVGRQSVCTTMSFSSVYNNGVGHRTNKTKWENVQKDRGGLSFTVSDRTQEQWLSEDRPLKSLHHANKPPTVSNQMETSFCKDKVPERRSQMSSREEEICMLSEKSEI